MSQVIQIDPVIIVVTLFAQLGIVASICVKVDIVGALAAVAILQLVIDNLDNGILHGVALVDVIVVEIELLVRISGQLDVLIGVAAAVESDRDIAVEDFLVILVLNRVAAGPLVVIGINVQVDILKVVFINFFQQINDLLVDGIIAGIEVELLILVGLEVNIPLLGIAVANLDVPRDAFSRIAIIPAVVINIDITGQFIAALTDIIEMEGIVNSIIFFKFNIFL